MLNESDYAVRERGGIPVRDYTQGGHPASKKLGKINIDRVARALILPSLGLGLMEVLMPRRIQKWIGLRRGDHSLLIRLLGVREVMHAMLIFTQGRPHLGVWSRVAGDALDLSLLGAAFTAPRVKKERTSRAVAMIAGITAVDMLTATQLTRKRTDEKQISAVTKADLDTQTHAGAFHVSKSISINAAPHELYQFWRNFENLPQFMYHLEAVQVINDRISHWTAKAPAGTQVGWDAEIVDDRPNELIAWRSTGDADVPNSGKVSFEPRPAGRGTVVRVEIEYRPPAGAIGKIVAKLFGEEPGQQVRGDLKRFKQVIETGEVLRSDGSPQGFGQKMQRPARPLPEAEANQIAQMTREEHAQGERARM